jgi:CBS domain-containing protein
MRVSEVMSKDPVCCTPSDTAQSVAQKLKENDVGSLPVVESEDSKRLVGMITDRDLCCSVIAEGLDPTTSQIERSMSRDPVSCRSEDDLADCEKKMQEHQVRRIPVIDEQGRVVGIVAQADLALKVKAAQEVQKTLAEISRPEHRKAA